MKTSWYLLNVGEVDHFRPYDALPIGCILIQNDKIVFSNVCFSEMVGATSESLHMQDLSDFLIPTYASEKKTSLSDASDSSFILKTKSGSKDVIISSKLQKTSDTAGDSYILTITERTKKLPKPNFEENNSSSFDNSSAALKAILNSSNDGLFAIDRDLNVMSFNDQAKEEFKQYVDVDLKVGANMNVLMNAELLEHWRNESLDKVFQGETIIKTVEREDVGLTFRNVYTPILGDDDDIIGALEVSQNITDTERALESLEESRKKYKFLIEHIPTGVARTDPNGKLEFVSQKGAAMFGYKQEELIGKHIRELVIEDEFEDMIPLILSLINKKKQDATKTCIITKGDGTKAYIEVTASLVNNGENSEFLIAFVEVTEKRRNEQMLSETKNKYDYLFSNMNDGVFLYDAFTEKVLDCNDEVCKLYGLDREDVIDEEIINLFSQFSDLIPGLDLYKRLSENISRVRKGEVVKNIQFAINRSDGEERLIEASFVSLEENDDNFFVIMADRTKSYRINQEIKEKTSVYEALIHNSFDGIDITRYSSKDGFYSDGELIVRNDRMKKMTGNEGNLHFDRDIDILSISPQYQPNGELSHDVIKRTIVDVIKKGNSKLEYRFEHESGSYDVEASQKMIEIDDFVYMIKNYRDITGEVRQRDIIRKQLEALNDKNDELKKYIESNLQLENFAYIASHDLKAPIRSVISFAQLLRNNSYEQLGPKNGRFLDIIITASTNMQVLIDDLLAYSRINTQEIEFEEVNMEKLLNHLLIEINESISEKDGKVVIKKLPEMMVGDASRLRQIFQNLVTNAMKFHKEGEQPIVEIDYESQDTHHQFIVKDFGIGIEPQYLLEIFLMFKKLHSENKYKGTGIGLSICKKIVEQHEGSIWVESVLNQGSTFYFTINKSLEVNI